MLAEQELVHNMQHKTQQGAEVQTGTCQRWDFYKLLAQPLT